MYEVVMLEEWVGLMPSDRINEHGGDCSRVFIGLFQDSELKGIGSIPTGVVAAFKMDEPVLKLLGPGETEWTEHRYTDDDDDDEDWYLTDYLDFEGVLYAVTSHGRVAQVDLVPSVKVTLLGSESYYEPSTDTENHFADVQTEENVFIIMIKIADGRYIADISNV